VKDKRLEIKQALEALIEAQRHRDFQRIAVQLGKRRWPELQATEEQNDGGEDATSFVAGADGLRRSLAASLTGTIQKIREDAGRIHRRGVKLDSLVFITPVPIGNLTGFEWSEAIQKEFGHPVQIISQAEVITSLEQPENRWLCNEYLGMQLEADKPIFELAAAGRLASAQLLTGWKVVSKYEEAKTIELTLREYPALGPGKANAEIRRITVKEICRIVKDRRRLIMFGEPGAGKTFTLIQIAEALSLDASAPIPIIISLPVWASSGKDFMAFAAAQCSGHALKSGDLANLCSAGHVAVLLNGWNEVSESEIARISSKLKAFALCHSATPIIVCTRNTQVSPPLSTEFQIQVAPLSHEQKLAIVAKSGIANRPAFEMELEANEALATITNTPLFLSAAIALARSGGNLPLTRHGILMRFVGLYERDPDHSTALGGPPCNSYHRRYLERIAAKMTQHAGTTLSFEEATTTIANGSKFLRTEGHREAAPNSAGVLDCLVRHHLLVLSPGTCSVYRFVHQQFQERFAAEFLHGSVAATANAKEAEQVFVFQRDVLNLPQWQEPLFFLMERYGNGGPTEIALATNVIRWAMQVNLSLASELAGAAGASVWSEVREELGAALRAWYRKKGHHNHCCTLAAMLATKTPDFHDILRPLLESSDQNLRLQTLRVWHPFALSSLGPGWRSGFSEWDPERKVELIRELSWGATHDHVALASELIQRPEDANVKLACFELLLDAGAYGTLTALSGDLSPGEWVSGFLERIVARIPNRYAGPFLVKAKAALPSMEALSARRAVILTLKRVDDPDWPGLMKGEMEAMLENKELDFRSRDEHWIPAQHPADTIPKPNASPLLAEYFELVAQRDQEWAAGWLANLLTAGRFWWEPFTAYIAKLPERELDRVAASAIDIDLDVNTTRHRAVALGASGSLFTARALLKAYLEYDATKGGKRVEPWQDRGEALKAGIGEIPSNTLLDAVLAEALEIVEFGRNRRLVKLASRAAASQASGKRKDALRSLALRLEEQRPRDLEDNAWFRAGLVELLGCVGQPRDVEIIEKWIHEDLQRLHDESQKQQEHFEAWNLGGRKGQPPVWVLPCAFWPTYQRALVQLGRNSADVFKRLLHVPSLLNFAAFGLYLLSRQENKAENSPFGDRPDYVGVHQRQTEHARGDAGTTVAASYADAIFAAVEHFLPEYDKPGASVPRHEMHGAVAALAALNDSRVLPILAKLASDKYQAWTVTNALHDLMLNGTILSGPTVATILEPIITEHEKTQSGSNEGSWHLVVRALAVLLFSDNPTLGVDRIRKLPQFRLKNYYVRELLAPLSSCCAPEAVDLLIEIALTTGIERGHLYSLAAFLSESPNPGADRGLFTLLDKMCSGEMNSADATSDLVRGITRAPKMSRKIWSEIKRRCTSPRSAFERAVLVYILGEVDRPDAASCLMDLLSDEFPVSYAEERIVEAAVIQHVPTGGNVYYERPREASELKKQLLDMAHADVKRRASALWLLGIVGKCRLEHGWPANEPFHPDIQLLLQIGVPWELL
jgi:hypothetical protein